MTHQHDENTAAQSDLFDRITPSIPRGGSTSGSAKQDSSPAVRRSLKVTSPEDVLAYIECTLGFAPRNSLVVVAFHEQNLGSVLRCDLPDSLQHMARCDTPESVTFMDFGVTEDQELEFIATGRHIGEVVAREPSITSALLMYLADDVTVSDQHALAVMGTAHAMLGAQFGLQGVPIQEVWLLHHKKLWHLRCSATTSCTVQGDDVGDPRATNVYESLNPSRSSVPNHNDQPRNLIFPPELRAPCRQVPDTQTLLTNRPQVVWNWVSMWESHFRDGPKMLDTNEAAQLLAAVEHPAVWQAILATACFDVSTAIRGLVGLGRLPAELAALAALFGNISDGTVVKQGLNGESQRAPDWQRIAQLERLAHQLLPLSDHLSGGALAGFLVWIEWARGRGSIAKSYVYQARQHFPSDQYLMDLEALLQEGIVAGWATRADAAWSSQRAA